jgi:hypothetical protein
MSMIDWIGMTLRCPTVVWMMLKVKILIQLGDCLFFVGLPIQADLCWDVAEEFNDQLRAALK